MNTKIPRRTAQRRHSGLGRLFLGTAVVGIVFSAGVITGQRLLLEENLNPAVSVGNASSLPQLDDVDEVSEPSENSLSIFSFYEALSEAEIPRAAAVPAPPAPVAPAPTVAEPTPSEPEPAPAPEPADEPTDEPSEEPTPTEEPPADELPADEAPAEEVAEIAEDPAPEPEPAEPELPARYTLQVASHPSMERARAEMDRLRSMGLDPHVVAAEVPGQGRYFRVRIGKFHSMDDARATQASMQGDQDVQTFVTPL